MGKSSLGFNSHSPWATLLLFSCLFPHTAGIHIDVFKFYSGLLHFDCSKSFSSRYQELASLSTLLKFLPSLALNVSLCHHNFTRTAFRKHRHY